MVLQSPQSHCRHLQANWWLGRCPRILKTQVRAAEDCAVKGNLAMTVLRGRAGQFIRPGIDVVGFTFAHGGFHPGPPTTAHIVDPVGVAVEILHRVHRNTQHVVGGCHIAIAKCPFQPRKGTGAVPLPVVDNAFCFERVMIGVAF